MNWLAALTVVIAVIASLLFIASAVYSAYSAAGITPYLLQRLETDVLQYVGGWLPWLLALLIIAAVWYSGRKEA